MPPVTRMALGGASGGGGGGGKAHCSPSILLSLVLLQMAAPVDPSQQVTGFSFDNLHTPGKKHFYSLELHCREFD